MEARPSVQLIHDQNEKMQKSLTYHFDKYYLSLGPMTWHAVPAFAVVTGENGAGKTHLLELLAASHGAQVFDSATPSLPSPKSIVVSVLVDGKPIEKTGRAMYLDAHWIPPTWGPVSVDAIAQHVHRLYEIPNTHSTEWQSNPLYADWNVERTNLEQGGTLVQLNKPDWVLFEASLTPRLVVESIGDRSNPALYFVAYELLHMAARQRCRTPEEFSAALQRLGAPPWELINHYCEDAGIQFRVVPPEIPFSPVFGRGQQSYDPMFIDVSRNIKLPASAMSVGERAMLSIVLWRFLAETYEHHFDILLMDEPDAHLHPSMVKQYMHILKSVMVDQYGARVILTTHSPTTVALAPEGSVFELRRTGEPRIVPVKRVSEVIARLTDGFVTVDAATKFVVIEGKDDAPFYAGLWRLLTEAGMPSFPGVTFLTRDGCAKVRDTVRYLRHWDFGRFYGLLDRDTPPNENRDENGIFVHGRNGVENYLFDPLNIWLCLWLERHKNHALLQQIPALRQGNAHRFKERQPDELQAVVDSVWTVVRESLSEIQPRMEERVTVSYCGGLTLQYPRWFIEEDDHALEVAIRKAFAPYPFPPSDLQQSYMTLNLIPIELWSIFGHIADTGRTIPEMFDENSSSSQR
ncbi:AAA family ATPase [Burkholderia pseudomallei]|uniref:AAA family ATPase n=1 Tax=Burkholderia pseudomallei TaxID=28450 RepID=UPI001AD62E72|nr:ATP-binding protein [Burkholderia pseudomallei]MBO7749311.1 ATP-binding protein [Burkholderia pseudomallei]